MSIRAGRVSVAGLLCLGYALAVGADEPKQAAAPDKDLAPRLVTMQEKEIPLAEALKALEKQTGTAVEDRRRDRDGAAKLKLDLKQVTFWQALEAIAKQADVRISLHERDRKLALFDHDEGYRQLPTSFDGLFRATVHKIMAGRDLDVDFPVYAAHVQVAWEPRFQVFVLETRPDSVIAQAKGRTLKVPDDQRVPVTELHPGFANVEMRIPAVPRSATQIDVLKGELGVIGATKLLEFKFDNLDQLAKEKELVQKQEGVVVKLREFTTQREIWTIGFRLEYPPDGPKFESFQSWVVRNQVFLEDKKGKRIENNAGYEVVEQTGTTAVVRYRFVDDGNPRLGKPSDWKLIYHTPSAFTEAAIKFEFKDVPLP